MINHVLIGITCKYCSVLLQVHFPDVERVEWLNKVCMTLLFLYTYFINVCTLYYSKMNLKNTLKDECKSVCI